MDSISSKLISTALETLLDKESHTFQLRSCLIYKIYDAFGSIAVGEKIVYKKNLVILA